MTVVAKVMFFLSSFAPLWLLFSVRLFDSSRPSRLSENSLSIFFLIVFCISLLSFVILLKVLKGSNRSQYIIKQCSRTDDQVLAYAVTYFPPLFSINLSVVTDIISLAIVYVSFAIVYFKQNAFYVNPLFAMFGYSMYSITVEDEGGKYNAIVHSSVTNVREGQTVKGVVKNGFLFLS